MHKPSAVPNPSDPPSPIIRRDFATPPKTGSLIVIFLTVFIDLLGFGMVLPLLPIYAQDFVADEHGLLIGLLMDSLSAIQFSFAQSWGWLSYRIGPRPVLMIEL